MSNSPQQPGGSRRSQKVALVLLGTAGVIGLATIFDAARQSAGEQDLAAPSPAPDPVSADRDYANNHFIPGVGYYHAPYHAWFPHPYNYYDSGRGYFAGGLWQAVPWAMALAQSRPNPEAAQAAAAAQRKQQEQQQARSGFSSGSYRGSNFSSSRPGGTSPAPSSKPSIMRGGFGGSSHPGGS